jgi:phosphoribosylformylglycinamidine synthase
MIHRIDVRPAGGGQAADPLGQAIRQQIQQFMPAIGPVATARIFLIDTDATPPQVRRIADELLADPIVETADLVSSPPADKGVSRIEVHLKPGVMDPVAASTEMAIRDMGLPVREIRTGRACLIQGKVPRAQLEQIAGRVLANGVIESVHYDAYLPREFAQGRESAFRLRHVPIRALSDQELARLSREGHLFLSGPEMGAIQDYYRQQGREPTDIELETLAQTWSEHCVHKTLKSAVEVLVRDASGKEIGRRRYGNLIKETIFASTRQLMDGDQVQDFCLSVFKDNAGVIAFDETDAVCFKVETHNHPSAIEPYGGSATGVGGVIRDILGTGLAARPIANTDVFCVAYPFTPEQAKEYGGESTPDPLPRGVIHPRRVLQQVVAGVRDYGNRMGIPTVNGAVWFDNRYLGNPLVFCGCVGLIPRNRIDKAARPGDAIVVMGGRTGRDGIHGATFSSAELTDTHADEFSHAVQIGNAITEKKMADVVLQARDRRLFTAITDCGAGGLSSAVGEMGEKVGARVELHKVPLKYAGLRYDEIWISEAQERMVLSVPVEKVAELLALAAGEDVEATVIGSFGTSERQLILTYDATEVGRLGMEFLHDGIPMPTRKAVVTEAGTKARRHEGTKDGAAFASERLLATLAHPNIASKHWIIRQYDHEVQGGSVIKPLLGPLQVGPSDAAVIRPKLGSRRGVAIACGLTPQMDDPYEMALGAIDEAVRNIVSVGGDPGRMAILDNFCWPSVDDEQTMGALVRACEACRDAALAYGIPFISGKDSLHNQFTNQETGRIIRIPNTLLISGIGVIEDVGRCLTMDLKHAGNRLCLIDGGELGLAERAHLHRGLAGIVRDGLVRSCHDVSDGGPIVAAAEMCIASGLGLRRGKTDGDDFAERMGAYLVEVADVAAFMARAGELGGASVREYGTVMSEPVLVLGEASLTVAEMTAAWQRTLDW